MRGTEAHAGGRLEPDRVLRQRGIGVSQHQLTQRLRAGRSTVRRTPGARLLGQRLAATMPCQPAKYGPPIDTKQPGRFTWGQPGINGRHQALSEVGRGA